MKFDKIPQGGVVVFVCGGTGLLPFCDFIDILFKRVQVLEGSNLSNMLIKNDPIVGTDFIKEREFVFYCASENVHDLPALAVYQLNALCLSQKVKFSATMRISKQSELMKANFEGIQVQKDYFN